MGGRYLKVLFSKQLFTVKASLLAGWSCWRATQQPEFMVRGLTMEVSIPGRLFFQLTLTFLLLGPFSGRNVGSIIFLS